MIRLCVAALSILLAISTLAGVPAAAEELRIDKFEPPCWWAGMRHRRLRLMLYGRGLGDIKVASTHAAIRVLTVHPLSNPHYAFVDLELSADLKPGEYALTVRSSPADTPAQIVLPILKREPPGLRHQGFDCSDTVYLITPDRFANGGPANDRISGLYDDFDPSKPGSRHGGDLVGIQRNLPYLVELGVTTLWLNPVLENNGINSYHGYKATDLYQVDRRFGGNQAYRELVAAAHKHGLKVIFDHVSNHIGIRHPWVSDPPTEDWFNGSVEDHLSNKHYLMSVTDPHAAPETRSQLKEFWFVDRMPDMNQRNEFLAQYLIQNSIWWIEFAGLNGIREDTYPYADQAFLAAWAKAIRREYPNFNIVGEIWANSSAFLAQFQQRSKLPRNFETNLPAVMDFPLMQALRDFLSGEGRLRDVHTIYAQDFLYTDIDNLMVMVDNHDTTRAIYHAKQHAGRVRIALAITLLGRGIPQILYGTELGLLGGPRHIDIRQDFPGGFPPRNGVSVEESREPKGTQPALNGFRAEGRTAEQQEQFAFVQKLLKLRKSNQAATRGKMIHFTPEWSSDVYRMLRVGDGCGVLLLANGSAERQKVELDDLSSIVGEQRLVDVFDGRPLVGDTVSVDGLDVRVFQWGVEGK